MKDFVWTDELVKEFCNWFTRIPTSEVYKKDRIAEFKASHSTELKKDWQILEFNVDGKIWKLRESGEYGNLSTLEYSLEMMLLDGEKSIQSNAFQMERCLVWEMKYLLNIEVAHV